MTKPENMMSEGVDEDHMLLEETDTRRQRYLKALTVDWRMVLYKIQYFFLMATESVDRVYFQIFAYQAGMSATQIGIITGMSSYVVCFTNPIIGTLANKYRLSRAVLLVSSFATAVVAFGIALLQTPQPISNCTLEMLVLNVSSLDAQLDLAWLYEESDITKFFYVLLIAHIAFAVFRVLTMTFTDVTLVSALGETGMHKYSRQKSFGSLGSAFLDLGAGAIVALTIYKYTICDIDLTFSDYQVAYYVIGGNMVICFLCSWTFKFENDKATHKVSTLPGSTDIESETNSSKLIQKYAEREADDSQFSFRRLVGMFCSVHYVSWLLCVFYSGFSIVMGSYHYLYLYELGGDALLVGVVSGVSAASGFIFYVLGFWIVEKLGTINGLYFNLVGYVVCFTILAIMEDPWYGLSVGIVYGCITSVGWVAIITHAAEGFTKRDITAVLAIVHGLYYGFGTGTGQYVGGAIIDLIGAKYMFAIMAVTTVSITGLFYLLQKLSKRPSKEL